MVPQHWGHICQIWGYQFSVSCRFKNNCYEFRKTHFPGVQTSSMILVWSSHFIRCTNYTAVKIFPWHTMDSSCSLPCPGKWGDKMMETVDLSDASIKQKSDKKVQNHSFKFWWNVWTSRLVTNSLIWRLAAEIFNGEWERIKYLRKLLSCSLWISEFRGENIIGIHGFSYRDMELRWEDV